MLESYLETLASPLAITAAEPTVADDGLTATADWQFAEESAPEPTYSGTIYLRRVGGPQHPAWVVVGATTVTASGAAVLTDVHLDGRQLAFSITSEQPPDSITVRVGVNGVPVSVGGELLPQDGVPDPTSGELLRFDGTNRRELRIEVQPYDQVEILVRHVGGTWLSLTHMAIGIPAPQGTPTVGSTSLRPDMASPPESPETTEATSPETTASATTGAEATFGHVEGTYEGTEHFSLTTGKCPLLDHVLDLTFSLSDGSSWDYRSEYCGSLEGDVWKGQGTFTFTTPAGDTVTGTVDTSARLPSDGEPLELEITAGTGSYSGASGSCSLDNHLRRVEPGIQEQFGEFSCDVAR